MRGVRSLQRLGQDADADQGDRQQRGGAPGDASRPAAHEHGEHEQGDGAGEHGEEPGEQRLRDVEVGDVPPRRDLLGDRLQGAVDAVPARRARQLAASAQAQHGVEHHPVERRCRPGHHEVDPHRQQSDGHSDQYRPTGVAVVPQQPADDETDGDHEVRAVREGEPGEQPGDNPCATTVSGLDEVDAADGEHRRPQRQRQPPVPRHRRQGDRCHHVEHGEDAHGGRRQPSPRAGEREQGEDDRHVLEQAERALGGEAVTEHAVPPGEHVQRPWPVEVQEVDVGDVAAYEALGEGEHEPFLHRPAGEAVEAAQRDHHQGTDEGEPEPGPGRRPSAQSAAAAEDEGGRIIVQRAAGAVGDDRCDGDVLHEGDKVPPPVRSQPHG